MPNGWEIVDEPKPSNAGGWEVVGEPSKPKTWDSKSSDDDIIKALGYDPETIKKSKFYVKGMFKRSTTDPGSTFSKLTSGPLFSALKGVLNVGAGVGQIATRLSPFTNESDTAFIDMSKKFMDAEWERSHTQLGNKKAEGAAKNVLGASEFVGEAIPGLAVGGPGLQGAKILSKQGAKQLGKIALAGGAQALTMPVDMAPGASNAEFLRKKAGQAGSGAAFAPAAALGIEGPMRLGKKLLGGAAKIGATKSTGEVMEDLTSKLGGKSPGVALQDAADAKYNAAWDEFKKAMAPVDEAADSVGVDYTPAVKKLEDVLGIGRKRNPMAMPDERKKVLTGLLEDLKDASGLNNEGIVYRGEPFAYPSMKKGVSYFTSSAENAAEYAGSGKGANVKKYAVDMRKPLVIDGKGRSWVEVIGPNDIDKAKSAGYDGIIARNVRDNVSESSNRVSDTYVLFDSSQAKNAPAPKVSDSFSGAIDVVKRLGSEQRRLAAAHGDTEARSMLGEVRDAILESMTNSDPMLAAKAKEARTIFAKKVAPLFDKSEGGQFLTQIRDTPTPADLLASGNQGSLARMRPDKAGIIARGSSADPMLYSYLDAAINQAYGKGTHGNPRAFATSLEKAMPAVEQIADPEMVEAFKGLTRVARTARFTGFLANMSLAAIPVAGPGLAPLAALNPAFSGPGIIWKALQSPNGRKLLKAAGKMEPDSKSIDLVTRNLIKLIGPTQGEATKPEETE